MQKKTPKNTDKYHWTQHVVGKMQYYGLSEQKVLGVIKKPYRTETGIAPNTVAVMQPVGSSKRPVCAKVSTWQRKNGTDDQEHESSWNQEIWVMYQIKCKMQNAKIKMIMKNEKLEKLQNQINSNKQITIISAWRFPGVSPKNNPIPDHVWREIEHLL